MINKMAAWFLLVAFPFAVHAQNEANYTITGTVKNINVQQVYLIYTGSQGYVRDSARVIDGKYTLSGYTEGRVATLTTAAPDEQYDFYNSVSLYVCPSEHFMVTHTNSFTSITVTGSPANEEYQQLLRQSRAYKGEEADKGEQIYGAYIRQHPTSPVVLYALELYAQQAGKVTTENAPRLLALINLLPAHAAALATFKQRLETVMNGMKVSIGTMAPEFSQPDTLGNAVALSSFRGKYVLIDFWASWCGPCRKENPNVVKAYQKYHPKGFEILGVSLDGNDKAWKKAILKDQLNWVHVSDLKQWDNKVAMLYGVSGIPQNFLIDPQGKIIATALRGEDLERKLAEIYP